MFPFVEPYREYPKKDWVVDYEILRPKLEANIWMILCWAAALGIVTLSLASMQPELLLVISLPLYGMLLYCADHNRLPYLFRRKRVHIGSSYWYQPRLMKQHDLYKQNVMEYVNFLRDGGQRSKDVERDLANWASLAEDEIKEQSERADEEVAEMFNFNTKLEDYNRWKRENNESIQEMSK